MALDQPGPVIGLAISNKACRNSSIVLKARTHNRFSLSVGMNRSAQPLPSGERTKGASSRCGERPVPLEVIRHVLGAVIVTHGQTAGDVPGNSAEVVAHALTN